MSNSYITVPPDSTGKSLQTFLNTINGVPVHAEALVLADSTGTEKLTVGNPGIVAGTITALLSAGGTVTVVQPTGSNLNAAISNFPATQTIAGTIVVSSFPATQTVAGAVTQGTSPWVENVTQFGGNAVATGTGVSGVGIPRVTVASDSFPATQTVAGTVTDNQGTSPWIVGGTVTALVNNFPTNPSGQIAVDAGATPIMIRDSVGEDLYGTNNNLNVHLASQEIFNLDGSGNLGVNVQGTVPISSALPLAITTSALPLPANAAQETGGNLASINAAVIFSPQVIDLLKQVVAQLTVLNLSFAANTNGTLNDLDSPMTDLIQ